MLYRTAVSSASENIDLEGPPNGRQLGFADVSGRSVVEVVGTGWTGTLVPQAKFSPDGAYRDVPYKNVITGADVAAATTITEAGPAVIEVNLPGIHGLRFVHTRTGGSVELRVSGLLG